jgi:hypothetical protein
VRLFNKKAVAYTDDHGTSSEQCSKCEYYQSATVCKIVIGKINPGGWCKKFKRSDAAEREDRLDGKEI